MTTSHFEDLANKLVSIFPTEIAETYFCRGLPGKSSTGKLFNAFLNTRTQLVECGLLLVNKRNKPEPPKNEKSKKEKIASIQTKSKYQNALKVCCSKNFDDFEKLKKMWNFCYNTRRKIRTEKSTLEYFNMFPYLKESEGYQLVSRNQTKLQFKFECFFSS